MVRGSTGKHQGHLNPKSIATEAAAEGQPEESVQVLLVEDDDHVRTALARFVRREGYSVEAVPDGASALGLLAVKQPQVIILDLIMPVMDGYEFMERLALQMGRWRPRIIVLSASERLDLVAARFDADAY